MTRAWRSCSRRRRPTSARRRRIERTDTLEGGRVVALSFEETAKPRLVRSRDDMAMRGTAWVAPDSGRVLRTRLAFTTAGQAATLSGTIQVDYAPDAKLGILVPVSMDEQYTTGSGTMTGHARYSNVRQFNVTEGETTRSPQ